jgi:hypothetical protein
MQIMRPLITGVLAGIFLGAGGYWVWHGTYKPTSLPHGHGKVKSMEESMMAKLDALELGADSISSEFAATGRVVRSVINELKVK